MIDGHTYTLTFDYAAAQQFDYDGNTIDDWVVTLGGQTIATTSIKVHSHGFSGWFTDSVSFTYDGGGQNLGLLSFANLGMGGCSADFKNCASVDPTASGGPPFSLLDGVSLTGSAPEPSTWAMMFIGFAGLGFAGLRNRRRSAISAAWTLPRNPSRQNSCRRFANSMAAYCVPIIVSPGTSSRSNGRHHGYRPHLYVLLYAEAKLGVWLAVFAAIFVPIERIFALHSQKIFRKGIAVDLGYYFLAGLLSGLILAPPISLAVLVIHHFIPGGVLAAIGAWPI